MKPIAIMLILIFIPMCNFADEVQLKDGSKIYGEILKQDDSVLIVKTKFDIYTIPISEVQNISTNKESNSIHSIYDYNDTQNEENQLQYSSGLFSTEPFILGLRFEFVRNGLSGAMIIIDVENGSKAYIKGIRKGDLITSTRSKNQITTRGFQNKEQFFDFLGSYQVGDEIPLGGEHSNNKNKHFNFKFKLGPEDIGAILFYDLYKKQSEDKYATLNKQKHENITKNSDPLQSKTTNNYDDKKIVIDSNSRTRKNSAALNLGMYAGIIGPLGIEMNIKYDKFALFVGPGFSIAGFVSTYGLKYYFKEISIDNKNGNGIYIASGLVNNEIDMTGPYIGLFGERGIGNDNDFQLLYGLGYGLHSGKNKTQEDNNSSTFYFMLHFALGKRF